VSLSNLQVDLKENMKSSIDIIKNIDLSPIAFKLTCCEDGNSWTKDRAIKAVKQYKVFLFTVLCHQKQNVSIVPTKNIDVVWHTHILDTQLYHANCQMIFGYYLHHFPYFGLRGKEDALALKNAFEESKLLYTKYGDIFEAEFIFSNSTPSSWCEASCDGPTCDANVCDSNDCTPAINLLKSIDELLMVRPRLF